MKASEQGHQIFEMIGEDIFFTKYCIYYLCLKSLVC